MGLPAAYAVVLELEVDLQRTNSLGFPSRGLAAPSSFGRRLSFQSRLLLCLYGPVLNRLRFIRQLENFAGVIRRSIFSWALTIRMPSVSAERLAYQLDQPRALLPGRGTAGLCLPC